MPHEFVYFILIQLLSFVKHFPTGGQAKLPEVMRLLGHNQQQTS